jgi:hypothetical protein
MIPIKAQVHSPQIAGAKTRASLTFMNLIFMAAAPSTNSVRLQNYKNITKGPPSRQGTTAD